MENKDKEVIFTKEEFIKEIKSLREKADAIGRYSLGIICEVAEQCPHKGVFGAVATSGNSVMLAKAWMGYVLKHLGQDSPYKNDGKRVEISDIEKTAEKSGRDHYVVQKLIDKENPLNIIQGIDYIREELLQMIHFMEKAKIQEENSGVHNPTREYNISRTEVWAHLAEARFHLGHALEFIREYDEMEKSRKTVELKRPPIVPPDGLVN